MSSVVGILGVPGCRTMLWTKEVWIEICGSGCWDSLWWCSHLVVQDKLRVSRCGSRSPFTTSFFALHYFIRIRVKRAWVGEYRNTGLSGFAVFEHHPTSHQFLRLISRTLKLSSLFHFQPCISPYRNTSSFLRTHTVFNSYYIYWYWLLYEITLSSLARSGDYSNITT